MTLRSDPYGGTFDSARLGVESGLGFGDGGDGGGRLV